MLSHKSDELACVRRVIIGLFKKSNSNLGRGSPGRRGLGGDAPVGQVLALLVQRAARLRLGSARSANNI